MNKGYSWLSTILLVLTLVACNEKNNDTYTGPSKIVISSNITGVDYPIDIYVPDNYEERQGPLPVIYASDGQYASEVYSTILKEADINAILVAIHEGPSDRRSIDYLSPGVEDYYLFLTQELIPEVEFQFDIEPQQRALVGHSYGGVMATYVMLTEDIGAEFFQNFIISDPAYWAVPDKLYEWEEQRYQQSTTLDVNAVISVVDADHRGNYHYVTPFYDFFSERNYQKLNISSLITYKIDHYYMWKNTFEDSLLFLFPTEMEVIAFE